VRKVRISGDVVVAMLMMAQLRRQADSTEIVAEPRIGAKGRQPGVGLETDDGIGSGNVVM
jgi:hypothetical protein